MVDALLLEWEGVLADTGAARRDALLRALAEEGVGWSAEAYEACCTGLGAHDAAVAALSQTGHDDATLADLVALRAGRAFVERLAQGFALHPGAAEFIADAEFRTRIVVVTRAARAETDLMLRRSGLGSAVTSVVTADDGFPPGPAPTMYEHALAQLRRRSAVDAERVVALVDSLPAVRAARAAGVRGGVVAVGTPAHVAVEADVAVSGLTGLSLGALTSSLRSAPLARQS